MTLTVADFLRRFLLHVPPRGFARIRHFGFVARRRRAAFLPLCFGLRHDPPTCHPPQKSHLKMKKAA